MDDISQGQLSGEEYEDLFEMCHCCGSQPLCGEIEGTRCGDCADPWHTCPNWRPTRA